MARPQGVGRLSYFDAFLIVLGAALIGAGGSLVAGRCIAIERRSQHHDVGLPVFAQFGLLMSVLIAFVFSGVWDEYRAADMAINGERSSLHGAALLAEVLPDGRGKLLEHAISDYATIVATDEWQTMRRRQISGRASRAFDEIIRQAALVDVSGPVDQRAVKNQILALVMNAHDQREARIYQLTQGVPGFIWLTMLALFVFQAMFLIFAGVEWPVHLLFAAAFAGCTVLVLVSIQLLDYPFEGALALKNTDFVELSRQTR
jgi:hypothetical protein